MSGRLTVAALAFSGFAVSLVHTLVVPALPSLPGLLHTSAATVSWLVTATLLASAVASPVLTRLGDQFGRRRMVFASLALLIAGSLVCAVTDRVGVLIVGRALQGCATAAIPLGISIIGTTTTPRQRASGIAVVSATLGIGGALGLPLSGVIIRYADFHVLFWVCAAAGAVGTTAVALLVPGSGQRSGGRVDLLGAALMCTLLCALLLALTNAPAWGWARPGTLGLVALFVVSAATFVAYESRRATPLVDLRAVRRRPVLLTHIVSVLIGFALYTNFLGTASYLQAPLATGYGFGVSTLVAGVCLVPQGLSMMVFAPVSARLISWRGARLTLALGGAWIALGFVLRLLFTTHLWQVLVGATVASIGSAIAYAAMPALILDATPLADAGAATGLNTLARSVGTSLASAVAAAVLTALTVRIGDAVFPARGAFFVLFGCAGALAAASAVMTAFVRPALPAQPGPITGSPS